MARIQGLLSVAWIATLVLAPAFVATVLVGLWTGWMQPILKWVINHLAELLLPGYVERNAQ